MATNRQVAEDLASAEFETSEDISVFQSFESMGLKEDLLRGIYAYGKHIHQLHSVGFV